MTTLDPREVFRQEASDLFETLEAALLDLCQRPDDRELVDSAFRALHTIKGSGAMFGFDKFSSFTHARMMPSPHCCNERTGGNSVRRISL